MSFGIPVRNGLGIGLRASTALSTRGGASALTVSNVFSTSLYTGTGAAQTITNSIDLAGKGGLVWLKERTANYTDGHWLVDTPRGVNSVVKSNTTAAQSTIANSITAFNSTGFSIGSNASFTSTNYVSWTFREAPNFFDVVTYTGDGAGSRLINHDLASQPAWVIIKATSTSDGWNIFSRNDATTSYYWLGGTGFTTAAAGGTLTTSNLSSSTTLQVGQSFFGGLNTSSVTYVAYLFANDTTSTGLIQCGSYTGNGLTIGPIINLGWEPQWLMIKNASGVGNWQIIDNMRGMPVSAADATLQANLSNAESLADYVSPTATGFQVVSTSSQVNTSLSAYVYIAIRKPT